MSNQSVKTKFDRPIVFRTCRREVYDSTLTKGSIWLRSSHYYRGIEDLARRDFSEGINATQALIPLRFEPKSTQPMYMEGPGFIGQEIIPHYILSMHGTSITESLRQSFGGYTLGIRCIAELAAEILYQASQQVDVCCYRFGQVAYQRTALSLSYATNGAAMKLAGNPSVYIKSINSDVLRKDPIEPFISQDEWRIAIFPSKYINDDCQEPLKINVDLSHFYRYIEP